MFALSKLRVSLVALLLMIAAPAAIAQQDAAPDPARVAAAKDLMEATGVTKQMDGMIAAMGQGFRQGMRQASGAASAEAAGQEFDRFMERFRSYRGAMMEDFAVLYAQRFTAEELTTLATFYRSGPGARFIQAMPELMQAGAQIGTKYAQKVMQETLQQAPKQ